MERDWLRVQLAEGRSIESIAREVGKNPSTVGYWVHKHDLRSLHAERHAPRGGIDRVTLERLVEAGGTVRSIAEELGVGQGTVRHWLKRHDLQTRRRRVPRSPEGREVERVCGTHGATLFVRYGPGDHFRCDRCRKERVVARRRTVKRILVEEAGGRCVLCGYARYPGALHFHHREPAAKAFGVASAGMARSLERQREEARKCTLLCANCHAEVEAGIATIPPLSETSRPG